MPVRRSRGNLDRRCVHVRLYLGIAALPIIPNSVVFTKMFNGLNSFTLLAVPLFILAANLMNEGSISDRLIDVCKSSVGHVRGGLAHANILVSMIFAGISGSSQADTAGVGKILIPAMEKQGYDKGTAVGVTAASSTLGSIIPPSITMVVYAGIANVGTGALFMTGLIPGIMLGLAMMLVVAYYSKKKNFPKGEKVPAKEVLKQIWTSLPALMTPIILGLIVVVTLALGLVTPPYGLCLLLAGSISGISIEESFKGVLPYFMSSIAVLALMILFSDVFLAIPTALFPNLF